MDIHVVPTSEVALYEQIATQVKELIISGTLQEGEPLPSVRALAQELGVSAITTRRAYTELEREGYVFTAPAKGTFVSRCYVERLKELGMMKIKDMIDDLIYLAQAVDVEKADLQELIDKRYDEVAKHLDYAQQLAKIQRNPRQMMYHNNRRY